MLAAAVIRKLPLSTYIRVAALEQAERDLAQTQGKAEQSPPPLESEDISLGRGVPVSPDLETPPRHDEPAPAPVPDEEPAMPWWVRDQLGLPSSESFEAWHGRQHGGLGPGGSMRDST